MSRLPLSLVVLALLNGCAAPAMIASAGAGVGTAAAQERGIGAAADDASIRAEINHLYIQKDLNDLFKNMSIDVMEGRVMLTGSVNKQVTADDAVKLAWRPKGVKEVINEIQVVGAEGIQDYSLDTYISTAIKSRMLMERDLRSINYTVETVNQTAYILGIARNKEELEKVATIASTTKYVKQVVTHIILQDDPRRGAKSKPTAVATPPDSRSNLPNDNAPIAGSGTVGGQQYYDSYDSTKPDNVSNSQSMYGSSNGNTGYTSSGAVSPGGVGSSDLAPLK